MKFEVKTISLFLLLVFLIPTGVKTAHAVEGHSHKTCMDLSTHIHQYQMDCDIDLFQLTPLQFVNQGIQVLNPEIQLKEPVNGYSFLTQHLSFTNNQLRAPPYKN